MHLLRAIRPHQYTAFAVSCADNCIQLSFHPGFGQLFAREQRCISGVLQELLRQHADPLISAVADRQPETSYKTGQAKGAADEENRQTLTTRNHKICRTCDNKSR